MADATQTFPQIPSTVWWGIRDQFKKSIPAKVSEAYLAAQLNVQGTAAKQYISELKRAGILDQDCKPTDVVKQWRLDDTYAEAAEKILKGTYPQELIDLAPPAEGDRAKAIRWFMGTANLGEGAAKNKTSTYFLLGSPSPPDDVAVSRQDKKPREKKSSAERLAVTKSAERENASSASNTQKSDTSGYNAGFPLNVNVQIHISADASSSQIEAIFANMKKYLQG